jgi:hypothetical protein
VHKPRARVARVIWVVENLNAIARQLGRRRGAGGGDELDPLALGCHEAQDRIEGNCPFGIPFAGQIDDRAGRMLGFVTNCMVRTNITRANDEDHEQVRRSVYCDRSGER